MPIVGDFRDARAAGPAWPSIHHHRARAAHADAAGETVGERRILLALDLGDDVEDGLVFPAWDLEGLEAALARPAPDIDGEHDPIVGHSAPSAKPVLSSPAACGCPRRTPPASSLAWRSCRCGS